MSLMDRLDRIEQRLAAIEGSGGGRQIVLVLPSNGRHREDCPNPFGDRGNGVYILAPGERSEYLTDRRLSDPKPH